MNNLTGRRVLITEHKHVSNWALIVGQVQNRWCEQTESKLIGAAALHGIIKEYTVYGYISEIPDQRCFRAFS